jgi:hypothetical protein
MISIDMHSVESINVQRKIFTKEMASSGIPFSIVEITFTDKKGETMRIQAFTQGETPVEIKV